MTEGVDARDDRVQITRLVMPGQTNRHGSLFGGVALSLMDEAAGICGHRRARGPVVTAHIESVDFKHPVWQGWALEVIARVTAVGRSSIRVQVETYGHDLDSDERTHTTTAEFVMVAVDEHGRSRPVPRD